jgi:3-phenylpropionate/trans-cinnamate dioxygenase ferredoxin reductase subunit
MAGIVVVGAGQAGCQLVSSLRDEGYTGPVTLVGSETHLPYQRPPLSKGHLTGKAPLQSLWLRPSSYFDEQGIAVHLGVSAVSLDLADRSLELSDGTRLSYEGLVLATGSRHRHLPLPGNHLDGVQWLRTLDEADAVRTRLDAAQDVVVIGGGFIGMEVAATACSLGKRTTVLEIAPQLMGRVLSRETAAFLLGAHRERGLDIELDTSASGLIGGNGSVDAVDTSEGRRLPADLVLMGVGAVPNVDLARDAGLPVGDGIIVDALCRTADPAVFAIGDCAYAPSRFLAAGRVRLESVQNATAQARAVAATLTGRPTINTAVPWFWSDQADLKLQIAGLAIGHDEVVLTGDLAAETFSAWCFANGSLVGVESINRPADHMAARKLLSSPHAVTPDIVRAPHFDPKRAAAGRTAQPT